MKIFDAQQTRDADNVTVTNQGITSLSLMERSANEIFKWLAIAFPDKEVGFYVICGQGNNGGDGLQIAKLLHESGYGTTANIITSAGSPTLDFLQSKQVAEDAMVPIEEDGPLQPLDINRTIIIDSLFGTGLSRELNDECRKLIADINQSGAFIVSVDMPSGMFMDRPANIAVEANVVLTFQYPKLAFFMASNYQFIDKIVILDIGLDRDYLSNTVSNYYFTDAEEAYKHYKPVPAFAHKGTQGHALIIGGSYGKTGAVILSAKAALKAGCGLVTAYVPECGYTALQSSFPEAMVLTSGTKHIEDIGFPFEPKAIAIGMGLGQEEEMKTALYDFLTRNKLPLIIDADALNILSNNKEWLELLPENSILTPHPKELERLIGEWRDDFDRLEKIKQFSVTYKLIIVAKDARTMIVDGESLYINSTGNSALATGGSGDVLAGIITGLVAQGYGSLSAAIFGVYLHGLTADIAVVDIGKQAFTASTILEYMGKAFLDIQGSEAH
jgi:hydroxyethylthiazole kinase-like uncharacterized protein yjeF